MTQRSKLIFAAPTHSSPVSFQFHLKLTKSSSACSTLIIDAALHSGMYDGQSGMSPLSTRKASFSRAAWPVAPGSLEWILIAILRRNRTLFPAPLHLYPRLLSPVGAQTLRPILSSRIQVKNLVSKSPPSIIPMAHLAARHGPTNPLFLLLLLPRLHPNPSQVLRIRICSMDLERLQKLLFNLLYPRFLLPRTTVKLLSVPKLRCYTVNPLQSTPTYLSHVSMTVTRASIAFPKIRQSCRRLLNTIRTRRCII